MVLVKIFPEEIAIENFKSIKSITLRLKPGVNLLVGPNSAGKTNILGAIHFFSRAISRRELSRVPYMPHVDYSWSPEDIFYMKDARRLIAYKIKFRLTRGEAGTYYKTYLTLSVKFGLKSNGSSLEPIYLEIDWGTTKLEVQGNTMRVYVNRKYLDDYVHLLEKASRSKELGKEGIRYLLELFQSIRELLGREDDYVYLFTIESRHEKPVIWAVELFRDAILPIYTSVYSGQDKEFYLLELIYQMHIIIDEAGREKSYTGPLSLS
jgi:hypothetical protein